MTPSPPPRLRVVHSPQPSMFALLRELDGRRGLPRALARRFHRSLDPWALGVAMSPVRVSAVAHWPVGVAPLPSWQDVGVGEQMACLRDLHPDDALDGLDDTGDAEELLRAWRSPLQQPREWAQCFARASLDAWRFWGPLWRRSAALWDREVVRVGTSLARGAEPELLNALHPGLRYQDGTLQVGAAGAISLLGRGVALVPMITGRSTYMVQRAEEGVVTVGYPLPGSTRAIRAGAPAAVPDADPLGLLLGVARAGILRRLERPMSVGELARDLQYAPSTVSYHCDQLQAGGLVERERQGANTLVHRTVRAGEVIEALSRGAGPAPSA